MTARDRHGLRPVSRRALPADTLELARWLIGRIIVRRVGRTSLAGRIVESEAYLSDDAASHSYRGPTPRNKSMFLRRGHAYVYFIYGRSFMLNVSSEGADVGAAVLIRALEPLHGVPEMQHHRGKTKLTELTRGPGCLAQALQIDRSLDGVDMCQDGPLWIADDGFKGAVITTSPRIGITKNPEPLWRFTLKDSPYVSRVPSPARGKAPARRRR